MENEFKVGDVVISEDFEPMEGREKCYKIGKITALLGDLIIFTVLVDVWSGKVSEGNDGLVGFEMQAPSPGRLLNDWPTRLRKV